MYTQKEITQRVQTRVVGVSFNNRQGIVSNLQLGENVYLVREPENKFDPHAVKVTLQDGRQFGYLDRYLAANLAATMDRFREPVIAEIVNLTGGYYAGSCVGVVIQFDLPD